MFRAVRRSSSGAPIVFAASGLHTHVVPARSQVKSVPTQAWLRAGTTCVCKPDAANTVGAPDDERRTARNMLSFNEMWNNKFRYQVASCLLLLLSCGNSLPKFRDTLLVPSSWVKKRPLTTGRIGYPKTSVRNYHYTLRNKPRRLCSHPLHEQKPGNHPATYYGSNEVL